MRKVNLRIIIESNSHDVMLQWRILITFYSRHVLQQYLYKYLEMRQVVYDQKKICNNYISLHKIILRIQVK